MNDGPFIAPLAALLGDPARANMLTALMNGRALTVSELAEVGGVTLSTASGHLSKLELAGLLSAERRGRHRYLRLSGPDVAQVLEDLMGLAHRTGAAQVRTGPRHRALRAARVCYDHLAGQRGVELMRGLVQQAWICCEPEPWVTAAGRSRLVGIGIDMDAVERGRRQVCRSCLDWSERSSHLGGALGAAVLEYIVGQRWASPAEGRVITFTASGLCAFASAFNLALATPSLNHLHLAQNAS